MSEPCFAWELPPDFDEFEKDVADDGWFEWGILRYAGKSYRPVFRTPAYLAFIAAGMEGRAEPNLVVVPETTRASLQRAVSHLVRHDLRGIAPVPTETQAEPLSSPYVEEIVDRTPVAHEFEFLSTSPDIDKTLGINRIAGRATAAGRRYDISFYALDDFVKACEHLLERAPCVVASNAVLLKNLNEQQARSFVARAASYGFVSLRSMVT